MSGRGSPAGGIERARSFAMTRSQSSALLAGAATSAASSVSPAVRRRWLWHVMQYLSRRGWTVVRVSNDAWAAGAGVWRADVWTLANRSARQPPRLSTKAVERLAAPIASSNWRHDGNGILSGRLRNHSAADSVTEPGFPSWTHG